MKINLKNNIFWAIGISLVLLIMSSIASFISIRNLVKSAELVEHSNMVLDNLNELISAVKDAETNQRGFLISGNPVFLNKYQEALPVVAGVTDRISKAIRDNPAQLRNFDTLTLYINKRMSSMAEVLALRDMEGKVDQASLLAGKEYMDGIRATLRNMKLEERRLLAIRTESLNVWSRYAPFIIVFTALLAIVISIFFYQRVTADFEEKKALQEELENRNRQIQDRIEEIEEVAAQVSRGNYDIRFKSDREDKIGSLAMSLNAMAEALGNSFRVLQSKEWLQTGIARVSDTIVGQKPVDELTSDALRVIVPYTESVSGAVYVLNVHDELVLSGGYSLDLSHIQKTFRRGEGIPGQALLQNEPIILRDIPEDKLNVTFIAGNLKPRHLLAMRMMYDDRSVGVIELASMHPFDEEDIELLRTLSENLGIAIASAQSRKRLQELLEQTQSQSEELQQQTAELENINAELEAQSLKLQASEEELRVQQEELLQSNQELEERTTLLEERNEIIKQRNAEIEQKSRDLEQSSKYKSEFLANMSHELRTPLNSILLLSKLMSDSEVLDKEYVEYADVIQSSGQGLLKLIDEILDLSKIESGKMQLEITDVSLKGLTTDLRRLFDQTAKTRNLQFLVNVDENVPAAIRTDKLRLEQILKNLLSNAFKFTSEGQVSLHISTDEKAGLLSFVVRDTGIGVSQDKLNLVFEAFQQADGSTRRKYGGTGLGLSISRELSKLLGGEIALKSQERIGSEFTLTLPIIYTGPKTEDDAAPVEEVPPLPPEDAGGIRGDGQAPVRAVEDDRDNIVQGDKVILIIEDETSFAKVLLDYAHGKNYKGIVASSGEEGLLLANEYLPAAILLDILLPGINGWQVMEKLKADPKTSRIPVHVMSSLQVRNKSILHGAVDFVDKPIGIDKMQKIFSKLEQAFKRHDQVLIVEESKPHAQALSYFLSVNNIRTHVANSMEESLALLHQNDVDCVILDMGISDKASFERLERLRNEVRMKNLAIIVFTGKNLSKGEELLLKKYADSIVVKTAHSYQRILDEAGLFLHLVEEGADDKNRKVRSPKIAELGNILKNKSVLVVDDDVRNIFSLSKALEMHNMKVIAATDGKEALSVLKQKGPVDAILMDMMMPEMDGYETIRQIRNMPLYKATPVLAVTAKAMAGDREKCIAVGASDYISKPVDIDQLISLMRVWLHNGR